MTTMNLCMAANSNYMRYIYVMLTSLLQHNAKEDLRIFILQRDFTDEDKRYLTELVQSYGKQIAFIDISEEYFAGLPTTIIYSMEVYFRLLMPEVLPQEVTRVLYLDVDIIVQKSLRNLYETDLDGMYIGGCRDLHIWSYDKDYQKLFHRNGALPYFNSGVMIWDLERFRGHYVFQDYMDAAAEMEYNLPCVDQEILNYMFFDKVKFLDPYQYNCMMPLRCFANNPYNQSISDVDIQGATILHFAGMSPWRTGERSKHYAIWWEYAKQTPFYVELLEEQIKKLELNKDEDVYAQQMEVLHIIEKAFPLKGSGEIESFINASDQIFCLYGTGKMAEVFFDSIQPSAIEKERLVMVDRKKTGSLYGYDIYNDFSFMSAEKKYCVIVTPSKNPEQIVDDIRKQIGNMGEVMKLQEFFYKLNDIR